MASIFGVMEFKEFVTLFVGFLVLATIVPLLFYPITDWGLYFVGKSPLQIFNENVGHYLLFEFWGFFIVLTGKAVLV